MENEMVFLEDVLHSLNMQFNLNPQIYASEARVIVMNRISALKAAEAGQQATNKRVTKLVSKTAKRTAS